MNRVHSIQYLRAYAALVVVAFHAGLRVAETLPAAGPGLLYFGHSGVDVFFVISGFIIYTMGRRGTLSTRGFLRNRVLRVAPLYWLATLAWAGLAAIGILGWVNPTLGTVAKSLLFIPHYSLSQPDRLFPVLTPGWTLVYEMFFYLLFALTLQVAGRHRLPLLSAAILGLVALGLAIDPASPAGITFTSPLMLEFLSGCLIGALWMRRPHEERSGRALPLALIGAGAALFVLLYPLADAEHHWIRVLSFGLPSALLLAGTAWWPAAAGAAPARAGRGLRRVGLLLGDASYSIYLSHLFVLSAMDIAWSRIPALQNPAGAVGFVLTGLVASAIGGSLVHLRIERPLHRWVSGRPLMPAPIGPTRLPAR